jgi:ribosomal protein L11 methyltransferase
MTSATQAWVEVRVEVPRANTAQLESLLESQGALSITLSDPADTPVLEPGVGETPLWPDVVVTGLFHEGVAQDRLAAVLSLAPGVDSATQIRFRSFEDQDWERAWMDDFQPMKFGRSLWIVPGDLPAPEPTDTILRLDPGLAFGSGTHPTTRLCMEWIDAHDMKGARVTDFGCGSGVLGIAAALRGAARVTCVDNDPQALVATRENAQRNGVLDKMEMIAADDFNGERDDFLLANILAGTLVELAPRLCEAVSPGGKMALSGILPDQADDVSAAYRPWMVLEEPVVLEDWVLLHGSRRMAT